MGAASSESLLSFAGEAEKNEDVLCDFLKSEALSVSESINSDTERWLKENFDDISLPAEP